MKKRTGANTVVLVPAGLQQTPQSTIIDYCTKYTVSDLELRKFIEYARNLGLKVILKPTVNCMNGVWRAFISFFDEVKMLLEKDVNDIDKNLDIYFGEIQKMTDNLFGADIVQ